MSQTHFHRGGRRRDHAKQHLVRMRSPENRFWLQLVSPYIRKTLSPEEILLVGPPRVGGCWEWQGAFDTKGYGRIVIDRREVRAHRFSYELANGPIPSGQHVMWRCGNSRCVRPDHLYLGRTPVERARREASANAKLTDTQVREIRSRAADGETMAELARGYGVGKTSIWRVVKRETWADV